MQEKPREIIVTAAEGPKSAAPEYRTLGLTARDVQTGGSLWIPMPDGGGREAARHAAGSLLSALGVPGGAVWHRDTPTTTIFRVSDDSSL